MSLLIEFPLTYDRRVCHYYSPKLDVTIQVCHRPNKFESITLTVRERFKDTVYAPNVQLFTKSFTSTQNIGIH